jgi:RpiB/LacA/LacB family sugar-phosphate isomerase
MVIYLGADHRGFELKEVLKQFLKDEGYEVADAGNLEKEEGDDYPDFGAAVAEKVSRNAETARGILICGSGAGMDIVANKFRQVRSVLGFSADQVFDARRDDDVNVLSLAADYLAEGDAKNIVRAFLKTPFAGEERHRRRLRKLSDIENTI